MRHIRPNPNPLPKEGDVESTPKYFESPAASQRQRAWLVAREIFNRRRAPSPWGGWVKEVQTTEHAHHSFLRALNNSPRNASHVANHVHTSPLTNTPTNVAARAM